MKDTLIHSAYLGDLLMEQGGGLSDALAQIAGPDLYEANGFRVLELPVDATDRAISRRRSTMEKALANEISVPPGAARILPADTVDVGGLMAAAQRLDDPYMRVLDELFWFWSEADDDEAFAHLRTGNVGEAEVAWLSREDEPDQRAVARHNLAVLYHLRALEAERTGTVVDEAALQKLWQKAYRRWSQLSNDQALWRRVADRLAALEDPRLSPKTVDRLQHGVQPLIATITAKLALAAVEAKDRSRAQRLLESLRKSELDGESVQQGISSAVAQLTSRVSVLCRNAEEVAKTSPAQAGEFCRTLIEQGGALIEAIDAMLDANDPTRQATHDELAQRIQKCEVAYSNKTNDWATGIALLEAALQIVVSPTIRATIEKELKTDGDLLKKGDFFCGPGYFQAPPEILKRLEEARSHIGPKNYAEAARLLTEFLKSDIELLRQTDTLVLVRKALGFTLGSLAWDRRQKAIADFNDAMKRYRLDLLNRARAKDPLGIHGFMFETGSFTQCSVCGSLIHGSYYVMTIEGVRLKVCRSHPEPSQTAVNAAIGRSAQDYVDAQFLDPSNTFIAERVKAIREECVKESIPIPAVSPWLKKLLHRDLVPSARPGGAEKPSMIRGRVAAADWVAGVALLTSLVANLAWPKEGLYGNLAFWLFLIGMFYGGHAVKKGRTTAGWALIVMAFVNAAVLVVNWVL